MEEAFLHPTKEDVEKVIIDVEASDLADWTKVNKRTAVKRFYNRLLGEDEEYPPEVRWIRTSVRNHNLKLPEEMLSRAEVQAMVRASLNPRDKALIATLYDSGARIGEVLGVDVRYVRFDQYGAVIMMNGKTGARRVRIIGDSIAHLAAWLEVHPSNQPKSPLFVGLDARTAGRRMNYAQARKAIQTAGRRAGIEKRIHPHLFRHSRATELARKVPEAPLESYMGWVPGSKMARTYVHLSGRDVDQVILEAHGLKEREGPEEATASECPRCRAMNASDSHFCRRCALPLQEDYLKAREVAATRITGEEYSLTVQFENPEVRDLPNEEKLKAFVRKMILEDPELREALRK